MDLPDKELGRVFSSFCVKPKSYQPPLGLVA